MTQSRLTNTLGTTSTTFSIDEMVIEHIKSGDNAGVKISFPDQPAIYLRATNPTVASKWYNGNSDPDPDVGNEDDYYLKKSTGQIFHRNNGEWNFITSILGPSGIQGEEGDIGPAGPAGPAAAIADAADANITAIGDKQLLVYDALSLNWVNKDPAEALTEGFVSLVSDQFIRGNKTFDDSIDATLISTDTPLANENSRVVPTTEWVNNITDPLKSVAYLTIGTTATLSNERNVNFSNDFTILDNDAGST